MEAEPFYDEYALNEWQRLEKHRTEFAVSLKTIMEFIPQARQSTRRTDSDKTFQNNRL
ncbi:MAG: hypothetical protein JXR32_01760 [Anaerolineaceae bacterium]|nr:hypothetical protein [Anaerolineaceae bacterium]